MDRNASILAHSAGGRDSGDLDLLSPGRAADPSGDAPFTSTGHLPPRRTVSGLLRSAHATYATLDDGTVADYIPSLAAADPGRFGISVCGVDGNSFSIGDAQDAFSLQSISKAFTFALVCDAIGHTTVRQAVGVNNTGLAFDSVMALELNGGSPRNPMVNAGALVMISLTPGDSAAAKWQYLQEGMSRFAGRRLQLDAQVYDSEAATNHRNRALAALLRSYGHMSYDPLLTTDIYTRQCSLLVTARGLAVMGATLADGGVNPLTHERVVGPSVCRDTLAVMATSGMYQRSGDWLYEVGLPGKSGVSGGIVTVAPGKGAMATYSPRLDAAGTSVRGQHATRSLSRSLGLDLFASAPEPDAASPGTPEHAT
ncbi:glutaminase [Arthrobacter pityocampae]|uniref:Glutaminase n=1 Tax=Arthrobacter pityocampae TaxID=547334 RepID=A0A2S5IZA7_9MICC|nr:glutaminase A [Arthrobacter pityocampae]PPB49936.1 glutaminase [Arthrobacter pityocampae]